MNKEKRNARQQRYIVNKDRINFVMPKGTKEKISKAAAAAGISQAEFIRQAIEDKINGSKEPPPEIVPDLALYARQVGQTAEEYTAQAIRERMERQDREAEEIEHIPFFE